MLTREQAESLSTQHIVAEFEAMRAKCIWIQDGDIYTHVVQVERFGVNPHDLQVGDILYMDGMAVTTKPTEWVLGAVTSIGSRVVVRAAKPRYKGGIEVR